MSDMPKCEVHTDTLLRWTRSGWVCPKGCADFEAGRRYADPPDEPETLLGVNEPPADA